ncbi:MAG: serine/threonine-protein kinase HipA [Paraglaciecola sp.]|jgi:serine/threonine-protein kinase HipA
MTLNGKQDNFTKDGFYSVEKLSPIFSKRKIGDVFNQAIDTASHWNNLCIEQKVPNSLINEVRHNLMLILWNGIK